MKNLFNKTWGATYRERWTHFGYIKMKNYSSKYTVIAMERQDMKWEPIYIWNIYN